MFSLKPPYNRYFPLLGALLLIVAAFLLVLLRGDHMNDQVVVGITHFFMLGVLLFSGTVAFIFFEQGRQQRSENRRLLDEKKALEHLLASSPEAHILLGAQGQVLGQQRLEPLLGVERVVILPDVLEALQPASAEKLQQLIKTLKEKGEAFSVVLNIKMGARAVAAHGARMQSMQPPGSFVLWMRDVSSSAEEQKRQSETLHSVNSQLHQWRLLLNHLPFPMWLQGADDRLVWCNEAYARAVDSMPEQVVARQTELLAEPQRSKARQLVQQAKAQGGCLSEAHFVVIGGQRRLLNVHIGCLGQERMLFGYALDVTREMELDEELKRHIKAHQDVLEQLGTPISIYGPDTRLKFYNRSYMKLWGADEGFLQAEPTMGEILEDMRTRRRAPEQTDFQKYKKERLALFTSLIEPREDLMHVPDGTTLRVMAVPHPFGGIMFVHEDVTDKLALESSYNTLIAVQRETLDNLAEGIAVYGGDGKLKLYNPAFARVWQLDLDHLALHPHINDVMEMMKPLLLHEGDWNNFKRGTVSETLDRVTRAGRYERSDGSVIEYSCVPLPDGAVLISYLDVSDSRRAEKALRETNLALAAADRLKSEFVANVSYQLRTPLNTIMGFAEILANQYFGALNERQLEYAHTMMDASKKLLHLINDVLDLATIEAGRMALNRRSVAVKGLLAGAAEMTSEWIKEQNLTLTIACDDKAGAFEADEHRMKQVLFNLISNAIQYTPKGGHITLSAEPRGDWMAITVEDDGMGIPEEDQARVFGKFERANAEARQSGAGLGLSLVKSFVELHGGRIQIESHVNQGTRIICLLPVRALEEKRPRMAAG